MAGHPAREQFGELTNLILFYIRRMNVRMSNCRSQIGEGSILSVSDPDYENLVDSDEPFLFRQNLLLPSHVFLSILEKSSFPHLTFSYTSV